MLQKAVESTYLFLTKFWAKLAVEAGLEPKMILWLLYTLECQIDVGLSVAAVYYFQPISHDYNLTWDYSLLIKRCLRLEYVRLLIFGEKNPMATSIWHPMSIYHTRVMRECGKHCRIYIAWFTKYAAILALCLINKVCNKSVFVHQLLSFKHCCRLLAIYSPITGKSFVTVYTAFDPWNRGNQLLRLQEIVL